MQDPEEQAKIDSEKNFLTRFWLFCSSSDPEWGRIISFIAVGALGFACNLLLLTFLLWAEVDLKIAIGSGITVSTIINFFLDRHLVFSYARNGSFFWQLIGFILVCLCSALISYYISLALLINFDWMIPQLAVTVGAMGATVFSYLFLRCLVFRA